MSYNWGHRRNRLRKRKRGMASLYQTPRYKSLRVTHRPFFKKYRRSTPEWNVLNRAWLGYVISKSEFDYEKMRKYAIVIRKLEHRLNIEINDFPEIGLEGFEEDYENREEDDDN